MKRPYSLRYVIIAVLLIVAWLGVGADTSRAASPDEPLLGITDTPTPTTPPTDTPTPTTPPTDTPTPTVPPSDTPTPTNTAEPTPPTITPIQPTAPPTTGVTPTSETPIGTISLPLAGQTNPTPLWLLFAVAGGFMVFGYWLLKRSERSF